MMRPILSAFAACALAARFAAGAALMSKAEWMSDDSRPVSKVISLLQSMLKTLEKEADEDEEVYEKLVCWCKTSKKDKKKSVQDAKARITELTSTIEASKASGVRLGTEIDNLEKEVAANQKSLAEASKLRQKQLAAFTEDEKDLIESTSAVSSALTVLKKHQSALLQGEPPKQSLLGIATTLQQELKRHESLLEGVITQSDRQKAWAFLSTMDSQAYTPPSSEIFGVLKSMKQTFQSNLASLQQDEAANQQSYEDVKAAKNTEITAGQSQLQTKKEELAEAEDKKAKAEEDIDDTESSLEADQKFLRNVKDRCKNADAEAEERKKDRNTEMQAVSKAIAVLSADSARDAFSRTFKPTSLLQERVQSKRRERAASLLKEMASRSNDPTYALLATQVKIDGFAKVKEAIDKLSVQLQKEQKVEIQEKDYCKDEFNRNAAEREAKQRLKRDVQAKVSDLRMTKDEMKRSIKKLEGETKEMWAQLKMAREEREKQRAEFQGTLADQRQSVELLEQAVNVLQSALSASGKQASLFQASAKAPVGSAAPAGFEGRKGSGGAQVIALVEQIIANAKAMEAVTLKSEEDAEKAYEELKANTRSSIESKKKDLVNKRGSRAKTKSELLEMKESKAEAKQELQQLSDYNAQLHQQCDFLLKNFDARQAARTNEIVALGQVKAMLSGSNSGN